MLSNILMKLGRNTDRKCSMQVISTTTTTTKQKFRFIREFILVLELKGLSSGQVIFWTFLNAHTAISKSLTFAGFSNLASHYILSIREKHCRFICQLQTHFIDSLLVLLILI